VIKALCYKLKGCLRPDHVNFLNLPNLPAALSPGVYSASNRSTRSIQIMFLASKVWRVHRADNLATTREPISRQCGISNISQPYRLPRPVTGITLLYGDRVCFL
jgi:hypothetical protein